MPNVLQLLLFHGRRAPDAKMDGWGFDARPIRGIAFIHATYLAILTVGFVSEGAFELARKQTGWEPWDDLILEIRRHDDLIVTCDGYFGDLELTADPLFTPHPGATS
ncbi:MAG: hypothetical protein R3E01_36215 [Pirellulaceae bacterium]|nr:hypothetical protein [Planctomycetales bacterium]